MSRAEALPINSLPLSSQSMPPRTESRVSQTAPTLILVPHVRPGTTRHSNIARSRTALPRARTSGRSRRRLRRPFRLAAYAVVGLLPLVLGWSRWDDAPSIRHLATPLLSLPSPKPEQTAFSPETDAEALVSGAVTTTSPASILLSIEPAGTAIDLDTDTPVVFPGYLLPDDHHEEPAHEGS